MEDLAHLETKIEETWGGSIKTIENPIEKESGSGSVIVMADALVGELS